MEKKSQILGSMQLKTTDELVEIWQNNDHTEWTNDAFDVVKDLLLERLGSLPKQQKAIELLEEVEEPAEKFLADFQSKTAINILLIFFLAYCLWYVFLFLLFALFFTIARLNPNSKIVVESPSWHSFIFVLLALPTFFIQRRVATSLDTTKKNLLSLINKGLEK